MPRPSRYISARLNWPARLSGRRGLFEPFDRRSVVSFHAETLGIQHTEVDSCRVAAGRAATLERLPIPSRRFQVVLPDSETGLVQQAEIDLCLTMSLLGGPPVPARGFGLVLSHSPPMTVHEPKCELGLGESLRGGSPKPCHRLAVVLRKNRPGRIQFAEQTLRRGIARLGGLTKRLPLASLLRRATPLSAPVAAGPATAGAITVALINAHASSDRAIMQACIASGLPHGRGSHARRRPRAAVLRICSARSRLHRDTISPPEHGPGATSRAAMYSRGGNSSSS